MSYQKSRIYQKSYQLAVDVEKACRCFPPHERYELAQQLRRAARSVTANFVEGYIRQDMMPSDCRRFWLYSQGSCDETRVWLTFARDFGLVNSEDSERLLGLCDEVTRMLVAVLRRF